MIAIFLQLYRESDLLEEKVRILRALGSSWEPDFMTRTLTFILTEEVMAQDVISVLLNMATNLEGRDAAWNFFKTNFQLFKEKFPVSWNLEGN